IPRVMPAGFSCGEHTCFRFDAAKDSLVPLILSHAARLIALGEAHAPADYTGRSTVVRFQEDLLPTIARGTSHLLVELLQPPASGCEPQKEAAKKESHAVTEGQSQNNQNEYLALGTRAHELGVKPDILRATCKDLERIASPDGGVVAMMESIARLSEKALTDDLASTRPGRPLVLAYGGALHNDVTPREGRQMWSYGPHLLQVSGGSYLEIDLIIPELIKETDSWKSFGWYTAYQSLGHREGVILMKWGPHSYSLFFAPQPEQ